MKKIVKITNIILMIIFLNFIFSSTVNASSISEAYNSLPESQLGLNNILNIILISVGIVIILLAIAILIKIKEQQGPSKKTNSKSSFSEPQTIYDNSNMYNDMFNNNDSNNYDTIKNTNDDEDTKFNFYR